MGMSALGPQRPYKILSCPSEHPDYTIGQLSDDDVNATGVENPPMVKTPVSGLSEHFFFNYLNPRDR